jgi:hypothetical protein
VAGVRSHPIVRSVDDSNLIMIDLEFDSAEEAETFRGRLHELWGAVGARFDWTEAPRAHILQAIDTKRY